jgi:predicted AlkP superfamily phosphohydrolase/phosphomutase
MTDHQSFPGYEMHGYRLNRREFLKRSCIAGMLSAAGILPGLRPKAALGLDRLSSTPSMRKQRVIIIGIDGMDPRLSEEMMDSGDLPNFNKMRTACGYRRLGTSVPPQSPVAWANFITGADPGIHGLFDFIHRNPANPAFPVFSMTETTAGTGFFKWNQYKLQFEFWPFNHQPPETLLKRQGRPFWDYLDAAGINSTFYALPSNYPPSPSMHGHHRCLSGMGTPDLLGTYGTYQFFTDTVSSETTPGGGRHVPVRFSGHTTCPVLRLIGPRNPFAVKSADTVVDFTVHKDPRAQAVVIDIQGRRIILKVGEWSDWIRLRFDMPLPKFVPDHSVHGICRLYLQEVSPHFKLYASPINIDPLRPGVRLSEPETFITDVSRKKGLFATTGFQEDHKALSNGVFSDSEFAAQSAHVLDERLELLDYAMTDYDDGLLFFYFSSIDMQSHVFWWDSDKIHPARSPSLARDYFHHLKGVYKTLDAVVGDISARYPEALLMVISDHGFCNFRRQFNLNNWLMQNRYIGPRRATHLMADVDWAVTRAYGMGINGLYINLRGRERYGIVSPGREKENLVNELIAKLMDVRDTDGCPVIHQIHRADKIYTGPAAVGAPDLIIGYHREYRASWDTCLGGITPFIMADNDSAWAADHCADAALVPGVLFSNQPVRTIVPSLVDLAPTVLSAFGLPKPMEMTGKNIFI